MTREVTKMTLCSFIVRINEFVDVCYDTRVEIEHKDLVIREIEGNSNTLDACQEHYYSQVTFA